MPQTNNWIRDKLKRAAAVNELHLLYWTIELVYPLSKAPGRTPMERAKRRYRAFDINGSIPAYPVGENPELTRLLTVELAEGIRRDRDLLDIEFTVILTPLEVLNGVRWHNDNEIDRICPACGAVTIGEDCECEG